VPTEVVVFHYAFGPSNGVRHFAFLG